MNFRPVAEVIQIVDGGVYLPTIEERFGIAPEVFRPFYLHRANTRVLWLVDRDLQVPVGRDPYMAGMPFLHFNMRFPRLTNHAAIRFGEYASRNILDLETAQLDPFLRRSESPTTEQQSALVSGHGYVIVRHQGLILGLGLCRPDDQGGYQLLGMCPKAWSGRLGVEAGTAATKPAATNPSAANVP